MKIKIQKLRDHALLPAYQSPLAAGADLYAATEEPLTLAPMDRALVPTGIAAQPDREDCVLLIAARSGLAVKKGVTLSNGIGVVDADYRGEICVGLVNLGKETVTMPTPDSSARAGTPQPASVSLMACRVKLSPPMRMSAASAFPSAAALSATRSTT